MKIPQSKILLERPVKLTMIMQRKRKLKLTVVLQIRTSKFNVKYAGVTIKQQRIHYYAAVNVMVVSGISIMIVLLSGWNKKCHFKNLKIVVHTPGNSLNVKFVKLPILMYSDLKAVSIDLLMCLYLSQVHSYGLNH